MSMPVEPPAAASETIRHVAGTMIWCSEPLGQEVDPDRCKALREVLAPLVEEFRRRFSVLADSYAADKEIDPEDIAVASLEKAERYFKAQRVELRNLRAGLVRRGIEGIGELDQLDGLYRRLTLVLEEARWAILIHDGQASEVVGTIAGGEGFLKFLRDEARPLRRARS